MNLLELEEVNRGVRLYEELKKLPLTKREKEVIVQNIWIRTDDFSVKQLINKEVEAEEEEDKREVFTQNNSGVLYYYLVVSESDYFATDSEAKIKEKWDLSKRMVLCYWVNHSLRVFIQKKGSRVYSSYQKNIARIKGIKLD